MFTGMDEVGWASMKHAYGSAEDVPELLRGLASACPQERERALDGMYGAVHHQGDVYDSTLACIPFLFEVVGQAELRDRGSVVELLVSIGGGDAFDDGPLEDGDGGEGNYAMARTAIRAGAAAFIGLLADRDPEVRRVVPTALVRFLGQPERLLGLLTGRLEEEEEEQVRPALAEGLGLFARLHPASAAPAVEHLVELGAAPHDPGLRLAALGQLAGCAPDRLPTDLVPTVTALLRARRPRVPDQPERPDTDTLIGHLRRLRPADEEGGHLLRTLHTALGDRTADRIALLKGQLSSDESADRCNGVWLAAGLLREWRGSYEELVALIGEQVVTEEQRLRDAAASVLETLFGLAAPAADHLAALVAAGSEHRIRQWEHGTPALGAPLKALARAGDPRAVAALAEVLDGPVVPPETGYEVQHLGPAAAPLAPLLRERLGELPLDELDTYNRAVPLLFALGRLGHAPAVPEMLRLLHGTPEGLRSREWLVRAIADALGRCGPDAREAIPALRELLDGECAVAAAGALWSVEGDAEAVLPTLLGGLVEGQLLARDAAEALGRLGPVARPALPALRGMADSGKVWLRASAASALWDIAGDPEPVLPALRSAWEQNAHTRILLAGCLTRMGPAGAPAHDLLRTELATRRRHQARAGTYGSDNIGEDEQLLRACRAALGAT
ncbi:HEAT repeat domain-containing protein [Streptomyces mirabilis]|uniref:HEAT repeat domain-containing protein n=1 Tax=Streptomyces mirabilis TaxID=68239 RepID=UPI00371CA7B5